MTDNQKQSKALMAMIGLGVGETVSSILFGWFIDKYGSKIATIALVVVVIATNVITIANIINLSYGF